MYTILLIDDSRVMRRMLQDMLVNSGFADSKFIEAVDGQDAMEKLAGRNYSIDAVFCDLCMPTMDGISFLEAFGARTDLKSCPVIILTADSRNTRGHEAVLRGASAILAKPFTAQAVSSSLRKVLEARPECGPRPGGGET